MRKNVNTMTIEGRVYQHDLKIKQVQNKESENFGKNYISGTLEVATDDECKNIVPIHYKYVAPTYSSGKQNNSYTALEKIISGGTVMTAGVDGAIKVKCSPSVDVNEFYVEENGELVLAGGKRPEGGFVNIVSTLNANVSERCKFITDMVISNITVNEPDNRPKTVGIHGLIFNFRNEVMTADYIVTNEDAMKWFESLEVSSAEPLYTEIRGTLNFSTETYEKEVENAWGPNQVETHETKVKQWIVTGANPNAYEFGDENVLTMEELQSALQAREVKRANIKKQKQEWEAQKAANAANPTPTQTAAPTSTIQKKDFGF